MRDSHNSNASAGTEAKLDSTASEPQADATAADYRFQVLYSRGYGQHDNTPEQRAVSDFASFRDALLSDRGTSKGQQWIASACATAPDDATHRASSSMTRAIGHPHRCHSCAQPRRFIGLDVDHGLTPESFAALVLHLQQYSGLVYTTGSHTPTAPRCRVVLELDLAAPRAELIAATQALRARIDAALLADGQAAITWDNSCDRPEQPLFLPLMGAQTYSLDGVPISLGDLLADMPVSAPPATQQPAQQSMASDRYAFAALERAIRAISATPDGARNEVLNREAHGLGGFIGAKRLSPELVEASLVEATVRAGWATPEKNRSTIRGGIASGVAAPRSDGLPVDLKEASNDDVAMLLEVSLGDLMAAEPEAPQFVIQPLVPRRVVTLFGGHGGIGKTYLALVLAAHIACGRPWATFDIAAGRVVFVSLEDEASIIRYRLRRVIEEYQLPADEVLRNLRVFDGTDVEAELMVEASALGVVRMIDTPMMRQVETAVAGADVVFVDNTTDAYGGDVNAPRSVRAFMRRLAKLAKANNAGMVLMAHISKDAAKHGAKDNSYIGAANWHNSARSRIALIDDDGRIELRQEKLNWGKKAEPLVLTRTSHGVPVPMAQDGSRESAAQFIASTDAEAILEVLRLATLAGLTVSTATAGPVTAWHALSTLPELGQQYRNAEGKRRVSAALVRLAREGRIVRAEYKKPDRHMGTRWELPQSAVDMAA